MSASETEQRQKTTKTILLALAALGFIWMVVAFAAYAWYFDDYKIVANSTHWGQFGDFIGGVLNPVMGFLALLGLLWTIAQNQEELYLTRKELRTSAEALVQSNNIAESNAADRAKEERKKDIYRMIKTIYEELKETSTTIDEEHMATTLEGLDCGSPIDLIRKIHLYPGTHEKGLEQFKGPYFTICRQQLSTLLIELKIYLAEFKTLADDETITQYYIKRTAPIADILSVAGDLDAETASYFLAAQ